MSVVGVGFVGGLCTAIGFDAVGIVMFAGKAMLNAIGAQQWCILLTILGPLASITSWLIAYMAGGLLGLIATLLGFAGGFFFMIESLRLIGLVLAAFAVLLGMVVEEEY